MDGNPEKSVVVAWFEKVFRGAAASPPVSMGELATAADDIYRNFSPQTYNPDLLAAKKGGLAIYKKMREDDQVKACLLLKKAATTTSGWDIEGEQEYVDFIKFVFITMEGTVEEMVKSILSAFDYGFSVHEKVYRYIDTGDYKGKIGLESVRPKSPTNINFDVDEYGRLKTDGILQRQLTGKVTRLPVDKMLLYAYQKEFDNYYGESDLKAAYRPYFVKTNVMRYWAMYLEKFGIPIIKGITKSGKITETQKADFKKLIQAIQAGMGVILPVDLNMELLESTRTDRGVFQAAIDTFNVGIARAILIPQLMGLVPQAGVGSYGKSETDLKVFDWILKDTNSAVQTVVNEQLIRQLIDINFGKQDDYPKFVIKPLKDEDKLKLVAAWSEAIARGAATSTIETEKFIRDILKFPEMTVDEQAKVAEALKNVVAPKGNSGLAGGPSRVGNFPGNVNQFNASFSEQYIARLSALLPGPESRVEWQSYVDHLDELEQEAKDELSKAFEVAIFKLVQDAKKKSAARNE